MIKKIKEKINNDLHLKELLKGGSISFLFRLVGLMIGYIFTLFVSRNYGADAMGILSLSLMVITIAVVIGKMGVDTALVRFIAEYSAKEKWLAAKDLYFRAIIVVLPLSFFLSIGMFFISSFLSINIFDKPQLTLYFQVASLSIVPIVLLTLNMEVLRGFKKIALYAFFKNITVSLVSLILLIILFYTMPMDIGIPLYTYVSANVIISIVMMLVLYLVFREKLSSKNASDQKSISTSELFSVALPMFLTGSMGLVMGSADIVMLGIYCTEADIGIYAVALKMAMVTGVVLVAVNSIAGPKFAELWSKNDLQGLEKVARQSTKLIFYASLPVLLIIFIFPTQILSIFGEEFMVGTAALVVLTLGQFINAISGPIGQFMNMTGNQKVLQYTAMMATVINIMLNYLLIPEYGIVGAAVATAIAGAFWNLSCVLYLKRKYNILMLFIPFVKVNAK